MHVAESVYKSNYRNSKPNIRMFETYLSDEHATYCTILKPVAWGKSSRWHNMKSSKSTQ